LENEIIKLKNIYKEYNGEKVIEDLQLNIKKNEFVTLLGPSGCGKTTTLRMIGGFEAPTSGEVSFEGQVINDLPPFKRHINTVFQKYALFPHMNVFDNIAFGLKIKKLSKDKITLKVNKMLDLVSLSNFGSRKIDSLSGGQQQRIAIARALVNEPRVLLLDEPLGALDLKLRKEMQIELKNMQQQLGITFIYVTHDQEEALTMSDTIVVMDKGFIQQVGTPVEIYNEPQNRFVANFIGDSNIIQGTMKKDFLVNFSKKDFECVDKDFDEDEEVEVVVRPEDIEISINDTFMIQGEVKSIVFKGVHYEIMVEEHNFSWKIHSTKWIEVGSTVGINISPENIHIMKKSGA
jgi:spermidine/putrescine transport system ATP-binding protein